MDSIKIILVVCWMLIGVGLVLFIWRRQSSVHEKIPKNTGHEKNSERLEQLYNFFIEHPDGVTVQQVMQFLVLPEDDAGQCLGQLAAMGVIRQVSSGGSGYYVLDKESSFNSF